MIESIIALKKKHNLLEQDATDKRQREWYSFAIRNGLVITEWRHDKLIGFLEYVRLNALPKQTEDFYKYVTDFISGPVILVGNCIAENTKTLWNLKRKLFEKNRNFSHLCWHRKKTGLIKIYKNIRSQHERALAS